MNTDEQESIFKASKYCPVSFFFFCLQIYIPRRSLTISLLSFPKTNTTQNINLIMETARFLTFYLFFLSLWFLRCSLKFPFLSNDHFKCPLLVYSFLIYQFFFFFFMRSFVCLFVVIWKVRSLGFSFCHRRSFKWFIIVWKRKTIWNLFINKDSQRPKVILILSCSFRYFLVMRTIIFLFSLFLTCQISARKNNQNNTEYVHSIFV